MAIYTVTNTVSHAFNGYRLNDLTADTVLAHLYKLSPENFNYSWQQAQYIDALQLSLIHI